MNNYQAAGKMRVIFFSLKFTAIATLPACIAFLLVALSLPAFAQNSFGSVSGVARDSVSGKAIADAKITARDMHKNIDFSAVTAANGAFSIALGPGSYEVTATKDGFVKSSARIRVSAGKTFALELSLAVNRAAMESMMAQEMESMKARIDQLESELKIKNAQVPEKASQLAKDEVLLASVAKDSSQMPPLPSAPLKPNDRELLAASTSPTAPLPSPGPLPTPQPAAAAAAAPSLPEALQPPDPAPAVDNVTPFAFGDFTWLNGTPRNKDTVLDTKFFTPEIRFDTHYMEDFNQPIDHTIVGATESFRSGEVQLEQISVGGDFHWQNVRGRVLYMDGLFATTTPRNDASAGVGQWDLRGAYKYVSEAWGGYHFNVNHGLNVDAGIFVSYIGLFSYYNFDNWTYQPSYVSSNTPWFFNGVRVQWFPTNKLKIEPWFINGWQSYAKYNGHPGLGGQLLWQPKEWFKLVANQYGYGQDNLGLPNTERIHTDDSIEVRLYNNPSKDTGISKIAMSLTGDAGAQYGGGLCGTCAPSQGKESVVGWMLYNRYWWNKDKYAVTFGGGEMSNYGRYLTLLPPINGADAVTGSPYFPEVPGSKAHMWDSTVTFHYMPREYITWWAEVGYRHSDVPYFAGRGGVTPPGFNLEGTNGAPGQFACITGAPSGATDLATAEVNCGGGRSSVWFPDLRRSEAKLSVGVMVKF
jgi:hypothetical protein